MGFTILIHKCSKGLRVINPEASNVQGTNVKHKIATECNGYFYTKMYYVGKSRKIFKTQFRKLRRHAIETFIK
jgi:hypothetical protein